MRDHAQLSHFSLKCSTVRTQYQNMMQESMQGHVSADGKGAQTFQSMKITSGLAGAVAAAVQGAGGASIAATAAASAAAGTTPCAPASVQMKTAENGNAFTFRAPTFSGGASNGFGFAAAGGDGSGGGCSGDAVSGGVGSSAHGEGFDMSDMSDL